MAKVKKSRQASMAPTGNLAGSLARRKQRQMKKLGLEEVDLRQEAVVAELETGRASATALEKKVVDHLQQLLKQADRRRPAAKKGIDLLQLFPNLKVTDRELVLLTRVYGLDGKKPVSIPALSKELNASTGTLKGLMKIARKKLLLAIIRKPDVGLHIKASARVLLGKERAANRKARKPKRYPRGNRPVEKRKK